MPHLTCPTCGHRAFSVPTRRPASPDCPSCGTTLAQSKPEPRPSRPRHYAVLLDQMTRDLGGKRRTA